MHTEAGQLGKKAALILDKYQYDRRSASSAESTVMPASLVLKK